MQWDLGYSGEPVKGQFINAVDISILGVVFNDKWFTSVGVNGWVSHKTNTFLTTLPPKIDSYVFIYLNNEFLVKPKNLINFSFPIKIGYGGATGWDTIYSIPSTQAISNWNFTGKNYYQHYGDFWTVSPGVNAFINIFKGLSLGVGANYRFAFSVSKDIGTDSDLSGYSANAFLRLKFDTRAYMAKAMQRQKEYLKNLQDK